MAEIQVVGGVKKLNEQNYNTWQICMESHLQGQDLWDVVGGSETTPPPMTDTAALRKWKVKAGKAMFAIKTTVEEDKLEQIRKATTLKEAWDTFVILFSKTNDAQLQLLENELMSIMQGDMTINQYFSKVKTLCREISELDPDSNIPEKYMKRIIIHRLRPEYRSFITAIQGWLRQLTIIELENLLADQEALSKQLAGVFVKSEEEAFFSSKKTKKSWRSKNENKDKQKERK